MESDDSEWLAELLRDVQLEQFYQRIHDELQITRLSHFDYVRSDDLERVGLGKPAIRRLMVAIKKRKALKWRRIILSKVVGGVKQQPVKKLSNISSDKGRPLNGSMRLTDHDFVPGSSLENPSAHLSDDKNDQAKFCNKKKTISFCFCSFIVVRRSQIPGLR